MSQLVAIVRRELPDDDAEWFLGRVDDIKTGVAMFRAGRQPLGLTKRRALDRAYSLVLEDLVSELARDKTARNAVAYLQKKQAQLSAMTLQWPVGMTPTLKEYTAGDLLEALAAARNCPVWALAVGKRPDRGEPATGNLAILSAALQAVGISEPAATTSYNRLNRIVGEAAKAAGISRKRKKFASSLSSGDPAS